MQLNNNFTHYTTMIAETLSDIRLTVLHSESKYKNFKLYTHNVKYLVQQQVNPWVNKTHYNCKLI